MTTVLNAARPLAAVEQPASRDTRVALLGLGTVGSAIARLARDSSSTRHRFAIVSALVRDITRPRAIPAGALTLTTDPLAPLDSEPDVVIEVLGGLEPARSIVLAALGRGIPVVTANKSLLAVHGDELFEAAARCGTPLLYEASVLAGVPFLGTFDRRPHARDLTGIAGILNGTSNFILSRMFTDRISLPEALADAQRAGYAEPDPSKDLNGADAVEKLCVLARHFGAWSIEPDDVDREGIDGVELEDLQQAATFGGRLRPIAAAEWHEDRLAAFVGPAFVEGSNPLAAVDRVQNAVSLKTRWCGELFFSGPGAGPSVTAATVLDDVVEATIGGLEPIRLPLRPRSGCTGLSTGWFVRVSSTDLQNEQEVPAVLGSLGIRLRRSSPMHRREGNRKQWILTAPCARHHLGAALGIVQAKFRPDVRVFRALE